MTRSIRLAAAILLLAIAALLFMMRDTAVNQAIMLPLIAVFATPGLALPAWGIVPRKGMPAQTMMAFKPATLAIGLLVSAIGVGLICLHQIIHVAPRYLMIGALLAVPGGLIYATFVGRQPPLPQTPVDETAFLRIMHTILRTSCGE